MQSCIHQYYSTIQQLMQHGPLAMSSDQHGAWGLKRKQQLAALNRRISKPGRSMLLFKAS